MTPTREHEHSNPARQNEGRIGPRDGIRRRPQTFGRLQGRQLSGIGLDEDNSFAKFTPTAELTMAVRNPELLGKIKPGQKFYLDFKLAE